MSRSSTGSSMASAERALGRDIRSALGAPSRSGSERSSRSSSGGSTETSSTGSSRSSTGRSYSGGDPLPVVNEVERNADRVSDPTILDTIQKYTSAAEAKANKEYAARFNRGTQVAHSSFMDKIIEQVEDRRAKSSQETAARPPPDDPSTFEFPEFERIMQRAEAGESVNIKKADLLDIYKNVFKGKDITFLDNLPGDDVVIFNDSDDSIVFATPEQLQTGFFADPQ